MPSRRQLLAELGSAASVALAGCTTGEADGAGEDDLTGKWRTNVDPASAQAVVSGETVFVPGGTTLYGGVQRNRRPYEYVAREVR